LYSISEALWQLAWDQSLNLWRLSPPVAALSARQDNGKIATEELTGERLPQLQSGLLSAGLKPAEGLPLIAPLMNLPLSVSPTQSAISLSPEQQHRASVQSQTA